MNLGKRFRAPLGLLLLVNLAGIVGYELLLGSSLFDAAYMTVITLSTVGFGETVPGLDASPVARGFTMVLILVGMGILLYFVSSVTAFFVEGELTDMLRRRKMEKEISKLDKHVIVCGAGHTGIHVIDELHAVGESILVMEHDQAVLDKLYERLKVPYVQGDAMDEDLLIRAGAKRAKGFVINLSSDRDNLFVTFTVRQLNPTARIVARGIDPRIRKRLLRAGADAVVVPNQIGGLRLSSELVRPHVVSFLDRMLRPGKQATWRFEEVEITEEASVIGRTLGSLDVTGKVGIPVLALSRDLTSQVDYYPPPETVLEKSMRLVILAERSQVERLRQLVVTGN